MTAARPVTDPLTVLSPELVLHILEFTPVSTLASLTATSKAWHTFIDVVHQDAIYASKSKPGQSRVASRGFPFLSNSSCFSRLFEGARSWKDLCKRQTLLSRNWADKHPVTRESVLQFGARPIWRFRADFKRRWFISTSQMGGLNVTDMDTGRLLWRLPATLDHHEGEDTVRPYAHLEYQDGMAVFDREGNALEVWQADLEGATRGEFRRIAVLDHDCQTMGFHLGYWTLCVVSTEGQGFVYDMTQRPPKLTAHLEIEQDAVGHLDQSKDAVIYSMGQRGYHVYDKITGAFLGTLQPSHCTDKYHISQHAPAPAHASKTLAEAMQRGPPHRPFPSQTACKDWLVPIEVAKGPLPQLHHPDRVRHGENDWGAGMLDGDLFVGVSRAGNVFVCSDWRKALRSPTDLAAVSSLLECDGDEGMSDMGGWLAVRNHRLMFEIQDRVYLVGLDDRNSLRHVNYAPRPSYSLLTSSMAEFALPVSFMMLCDDAIMTSYTVCSTFIHCRRVRTVMQED